MLHQVEETVNSNLNFDMLIRTTFMIFLENFKDVFIHFIRTSYGLIQALPGIFSQFCLDGTFSGSSHFSFVFPPNTLLFEHNS